MTLYISTQRNPLPFDLDPFPLALRRGILVVQTYTYVKIRYDTLLRVVSLDAILVSFRMLKV